MMSPVLLFTEATAELLLDQVSDLLAFVGVTLLDKENVSPMYKVIVERLRVTLVTLFDEEPLEALAVNLCVAVNPPSLVFTVIVALPAFLTVTLPVAETVATEVLLELHVTFLLLAFDGFTVAVS